MNKKNIDYCEGGTIAGRGSVGRCKLSSRHFDGKKSYKAFRQIPVIWANLNTIQLYNETRMIWGDKWVELRKICHELENRYVDGIVITHEFDTLEETAFFKSYLYVRQTSCLNWFNKSPATATSDVSNEFISSRSLACHMEAWQAGVLAVISEHDLFRKRLTKDK